MKTITINSNDAGQRLDKFLSKRFKTCPKSLMYKYIRTKYIKLNSKKCVPDAVLSEGDVLTLYIRDEFFEQRYDEYEFMKAPTRLDIVYEDDNLLILDKPEGLLTHPDSSYHFDSLVARVQHYLYDKGEYDPKNENSFAPAAVNRIDRNTGGIVIAAKNAQALKSLAQAVRLRTVSKYYLCLCEGTLKKKSATLTGSLLKDEKKNRVTVLNPGTEGARDIETRYTVLDENGKISLLEVELITGRTHQIRAHLASIGHPLCGDKKYGGKSNFAKGHTGQALVAYKIAFGEISDPVTAYLSGKEFRVKDVWFEHDGRIIGIYPAKP